MPAAGSSLRAASASRASSRRARRPARSSMNEPDERAVLVQRRAIRTGVLLERDREVGAALELEPEVEERTEAEAAKGREHARGARRLAGNLLRLPVVERPVGHAERLRPRRARSCLTARTPVRDPRVVTLRMRADPGSAPDARTRHRAGTRDVSRGRPSSVRSVLERAAKVRVGELGETTPRRDLGGEESLRLPHAPEARRFACVRGRSARAHAGDAHASSSACARTRGTGTVRQEPSYVLSVTLAEDDVMLLNHRCRHLADEAVRQRRHPIVLEVEVIPGGQCGCGRR